MSEATDMLRETLDEKNAENAQLRERMKELATAGEDVFKKLMRARRERHELQNQLTAAQERVKDLEDDADSAERKITEMGEWLRASGNVVAQRDAEIADLREEIGSLTPNAILECEVVELRKDRERLEWVIEHKATLYHIDEGWCCEWQSSRFIEDADCDIEEPRDTPREAIDSAIEDFASEDAAIAAEESAPPPQCEHPGTLIELAPGSFFRAAACPKCGIDLITENV